MSREDFSLKFIRTLEDGKLALKNNETDTACIFLENKKCSVYEARPTQCRTFPFWPHQVHSPSDWAQAARECEGIAVDSKENLVATDEIVEEMLIQSVYNDDDALETTYSMAKELVHEIDPDLVREFKADFFDTHQREVVFENEEMMIVDTVTPDLPVCRALVLKDSIKLTQTAINLDPKGGFDHKTILLAVHQAMMCVPAIAGEHHFIGAGGGALPMFTKCVVPEARVIVVDHSQGVLDVAQRFFGMEGVQTVVASAEDYLKTVRGASRIFLDIGNDWTQDEALLNSISADCLREDGMLIVNVVVQEGQNDLQGRGENWIRRLSSITPHIVLLSMDHNVVFFCSKQPSDQLESVTLANEAEKWGLACDAVALLQELDNPPDFPPVDNPTITTAVDDGNADNKNNDNNNNADTVGKK